MPKLLLDIAERTAATYAVTFLGLLLTNGVDLTNVSTVRAAAVAAIPAALSIVKGVLASFIGNHQSAALLPADSSR